VEDRISSYRQVRILLYPHKERRGYSWAVMYVTVSKGVPRLVPGPNGVVDDPDDEAQVKAFDQAVWRAAEDCY
jgi:hypothetical protein